MNRLVKHLQKIGVLKTPWIIAAFLKNDRVLFVPINLKEDAYLDMPLPIGRNQTISQPYTVAFMMELLSPAPGQKILDIGFGSGWTTGILASIVGERGRVWGLEIDAEIYEFGRGNLLKSEYTNLKLLNQSGWDGLVDYAPFDRILVSAAAPKRVPAALKEQLSLGGRLVIPVAGDFGQSIQVWRKIDKNKFEKADYPGFAFVPFVK